MVLVTYNIKVEKFFSDAIKVLISTESNLGRIKEDG
jgi:hypothetical protein